MKQDFHGYYRPTDEEFDRIWNEAIIVIDANVILNLYTYSSSTANEVLSLLGEFGEQLWMPHQVALEYHKNRCSIILKESKRYTDIAKDLEKVGTALRTRKEHPHITSELAEKFEDVENEIKRELTEGKNQCLKLISISADSICAKITELFDQRVGSAMTEEVLEKIYKEGATRYTKKIPPGFKDKDKAEPNKYGDLVIWNQIIDHALTSNRSVIFVTDDLKEDWWALVNSQNIGPRPELRHEFRNKTNHNIYIYSTDTFIENANGRGKKLSKPAAEEIESASKERQQEAVREQSLLQVSDDALEAAQKQRESMKPLLDNLEAVAQKQRESMKPLLDNLEAAAQKQRESMKPLLDNLEVVAQKQRELMKLFLDSKSDR